MDALPAELATIRAELIAAVHRADLAEAQRRAAIALATERAARIDDLRIALRALEAAPQPKPLPTPPRPAPTPATTVDNHPVSWLRRPILGQGQ